MKQIILDLQVSCKNLNKLPPKHKFIRWLYAAVPHFSKTLEITIRIVDEIESKYLNLTYRKINKPTNVLSFPFNIPSNITMSSILLGDIIICHQLIEQEAKHQQLVIIEHWAHIVIHGVLHLIGYNHINIYDEKKMKSIETRIMLSLGYKDPYSLKR